MSLGKSIRQDTKGTAQVKAEQAEGNVEAEEPIEGKVKVEVKVEVECRRKVEAEVKVENEQEDEVEEVEVETEEVEVKVEVKEVVIGSTSRHELCRVQ